MKKLKICFINNDAALYRKAIYKLMDSEFEVDWHFGPGSDGIKQFPISELKNAYLHDIIKIAGPLCFQKGTVSLLLSRKYDVFFILGEFPDLAVWVGMLLHNIFNRKKKVYFWTHGMLRVRNWPRKWFDKLFFHLPYASFTYGDRARKVMISQGFDPDKLFAIHNSLDYEKQKEQRKQLKDSRIYQDHFKNNLPVIIFIGRLIRDKKLGMILEADRIMKKQGIEFNVVFIGKGEDKEYLNSLTEEYKLKDNVWFYGACYEEEKLAGLIYNADICVSPGPIGLTAMHAMVYGCPVITNDNVGYHGPEHEAIKEGVTGSFFSNGNAENLAKTINTWLNSSMDREQMRQNCYNEIDTNWTPYYQIEVIKKHLIK